MKFFSFADDSKGCKSFALKSQYQILRSVYLIIKRSNDHFMKITDNTELLLLYPPSLAKEVIMKGVLFEDQCIRFSEVLKNLECKLIQISA